MAIIKTEKELQKEQEKKIKLHERKLAKEEKKKEELKGTQLFEKIGNDKYLIYCVKESKQKYQKIIALFCVLRGYHFDNYKQLSSFFTRNGTVAKRLEGFSSERIKATVEYLLNKKDINFKIGLETVEKYIMDVTVPEHESIIVLKSGERVLTAKRAKELEAKKIIYYKEGKWYEYS